MTRRFLAELTDRQFLGGEILRPATLTWCVSAS